MPLQKFLIAPYKSGLDDEVEPWLTPEDAFSELNNGYIYRGVLRNRRGFNALFDGGEGGSARVQSRLVEGVSTEATALTNDGAQKNYTVSNLPTVPGGITITAGAKSITDDGSGALTGDINGAGTNTVNYDTGVLDFQFDAANAAAITVDYSYYPGRTVTGLATYQTGSNTIRLIAFDTRMVNQLSQSTNAFDYVSPGSSGAFSGDASNFVSWDNYTSLTFNTAATKAITAITQANPCVVTAASHGFLTNDKIEIANVGGMTDLNIKQSYRVIVDGATDESNGNTDGAGAASFSLANAPRANDITITIGVETITDDGAGILTGSAAATGTVDYNTGAITIASAAASTAITSTYNVNTIVLDGVDSRRFTTYTSGGTVARVLTAVGDRPILVFANNVNPIQVWDGSTISDYNDEAGYKEPGPDRGGDIDLALHVVNYQDRLLFLRPTQNSTVYPQRVLYSGTGPNRNDFDATDAGFIEAPTADWLETYAFFRGEMVVFFENSTWLLKATGQFDAPYRFVQLDDSRGSKAPFSGVSYLNRCAAVAPRGIIATDGYEVSRADTKIPDFTTLSVDQERFNLVFGGSNDLDRQHVWLYPEEENSASNSTAILAANYEENTFARWTKPLSCLGRYRSDFEPTWSDLTNSWESYTNSWTSFGRQGQAFFMIAGDHDGFVYGYVSGEYQDNTFDITGITVGAATTIKTRQNNMVSGAIIRITDIDGSSEVEALNGNDYLVTVVDAYNFTIQEIGGTAVDTTGGSWTSGGLVQLGYNFEVLSKPWNPFIEQDKRCRLSYVEFYVTTDSTATCDVEFFVDDRSTPYKTVAIDFGDSTGRKKKWFRITANQTADFHRIKFVQHRADQPIEIHGTLLAMEPVGSIGNKRLT